MKIIAMINLRAGKTMADLMPLRAAEAGAAWELFKAGKIRELHYRDDFSGAAVQLEADTQATAAAWLAELPAVKAGVLEVADVAGLVPYVGWEALFRDDLSTRTVGDQP